MNIITFPDMKVSKKIPSERKQNICTIVHHPEKNEAIFADLGGHWGLLEDLSSSGNKTEATSKTEAADDDDMEALFNDDDDDENSFSVSKVAAQAGYTKDADGNLTFSGEGGEAGAGGNNDERPSSVLSNVSNATPGYRDRPAPPAPRARLQAPFQPGASPEGLSNR